MKKVLIVDDDKVVSDTVRSLVNELGHEAEVIDNGDQGLKAALGDGFLLVVLDVGLPGMSGFDVLQQLRVRKPELLVLMLTSRSDEIDRVLAFELGADDYVSKPFSQRELAGRIKALLRRSQVPPPAASDVDIRCGGLVINSKKREVTLDGKIVPFTNVEFDLLHLMASNAGRAFSREDLMHLVWGINASEFGPTVTSHLSRIRSKLEADPSRPKYILTVRGFGYRFAEPKELE